MHFVLWFKDQNDRTMHLSYMLEPNIFPKASVFLIL